MKKEIFYYRNKDPDFYFKENNLFRKDKDSEKFILSVDPKDNPGNDEYIILFILDFDNYYVILISWMIDRNIFCFRKNSDEFLWRINPPKAVWQTRENYWCNIRQESEQDNKVYCFSVDRYVAAYDLETGKMVLEQERTGGDPRDF